MAGAVTAVMSGTCPTLNWILPKCLVLENRLHHNDNWPWKSRVGCCRARRGAREPQHDQHYLEPESRLRCELMTGLVSRRGGHLNAFQCESG